MTQYTIPNIDFNSQVTTSDGKLSPQYVAFFTGIKGLVDSNFNTNGLHAPDMESSDLSDDSKVSNGVIYYNTTDNQLETVIDGVKHKVTTTPV